MGINLLMSNYALILMYTVIIIDCFYFTDIWYLDVEAAAIYWCVPQTASYSPGTSSPQQVKTHTHTPLCSYNNRYPPSTVNTRYTPHTHTHTRTHLINILKLFWKRFHKKISFYLRFKIVFMRCMIYNLKSKQICLHCIES